MLKQKVNPRSGVKTSMSPAQRQLAETAQERRQKVTAMLAGFRKARLGSEADLADAGTMCRDGLAEKEMLREKNAAKEAKARMKRREELTDQEIEREKTGEMAAEARADFVLGLSKDVHLQLQGANRAEKAMRGKGPGEKMSGKKKHFAGHKKH